MFTVIQASDWPNWAVVVEIGIFKNNQLFIYLKFKCISLHKIIRKKNKHLLPNANNHEKNVTFDYFTSDEVFKQFIYTVIHFNFF